MRIDISAIAPENWDSYVGDHEASTAFHFSSAVAIGSAVFGLKTYYLTAFDRDGKTAGILPLVEQSSMLFGRFLSSLPFVTYGGILADNQEAELALALRASELARERNAKHVEFRHRQAGLESHYQERLDKVSMLLALPEAEDILSKQLGSKLRSQISRAEREKPEVVWGRLELIDDFFSIFSAGMHGLGTPVYPKRFFKQVLDAISSSSIIVVRVNGKPEAAALVVNHGRAVEVPWAAASLWGKKNAINMRMYWEMLKYSVASGADSFDFGRSSVDSGTYRFKKQWGAEPRQLHWFYWLPDGSTIPKLNHSNPKYELAIRMWQRMPLWCANFVGPRISGKLP